MKEKQKVAIVHVKNKNGAEKAVVVDPDREQRYGKIIEEISNKDNCMDVFRDILDYMKQNDSDEAVGLKIEPSSFIKMKMNKNSRVKVKTMLGMATKMKAISGLAFLQCLLKRIELTKQLFMIEIQLGQEVFIPEDLS